MLINSRNRFLSRPSHVAYLYLFIYLEGILTHTYTLAWKGASGTCSAFQLGLFIGARSRSPASEHIPKIDEPPSPQRVLSRLGLRLCRLSHFDRGGKMAHRYTDISLPPMPRRLRRFNGAVPSSRGGWGERLTLCRHYFSPTIAPWLWKTGGCGSKSLSTSSKAHPNCASRAHLERPSGQPYTTDQPCLCSSWIRRGCRSYGY